MLFFDKTYPKNDYRVCFLVLSLFFADTCTSEYVVACVEDQGLLDDITSITSVVFDSVACFSFDLFRGSTHDASVWKYSKH